MYFSFLLIRAFIWFCVGETSGTTATFVIVDRWTVTVASVGDSRCVLDAQGGAVSSLTVDHRLEENIEEYVFIPYGLVSLLLFFLYAFCYKLFCLHRRERVTASGGEVGRLSIVGGAEVSIFSCSYIYFFILKWKKGEILHLSHAPFSASNLGSLNFAYPCFEV